MTLDHDYLHDDGGGGALLGSLKETELRLGLPGSESPERVEKAVLSLGLAKGPSSYTSSGAKRGYSDAINGTGKWVFSTGGNRSDSELGKNGAALFSPRGMGENGGGGVKDAGLGTKLADNDNADKKKKTHVSSGGLAPAPTAQVVGWPPIRNYRKNTMATNSSKKSDDSILFISFCNSIESKNMASLGAAGVGMGMRMGMGSREEGIKGRRMNLATMATKKNAGGSAEEKGPFDWVLSGMQKDQLLETDPVLKKMDDDDNKTTGTTSRKVAVAANEAKKKFPGFGGLFSKK